MSRRRNGQLRCSMCRMHRVLCICEFIPRIETKTRLLLVMHRFEERKTTNTGRLASQCLPNSEIVMRGERGDDAQFTLPDASQALLLFPHAEAQTLSRELIKDMPNPTLVVPDGTWRQASRVRHRLSLLQSVPCVTLPADAPTTYRLRSEAHEGRLSTLEAIARALAILEGPTVRTQLEEVFQIMVERTLWSRGVLKASHVTRGIPEVALAWQSTGIP